MIFRDFTAGALYPSTLTLPPEGGRCEKIGIFPLTQPSPTRGEGKNVEIEQNFPPPRRRRAWVGVIQGIFQTFGEGSEGIS